MHKYLLARYDTYKFTLQVVGTGYGIYLTGQPLPPISKQFSVRDRSTDSCLEPLIGFCGSKPGAGSKSLHTV